MDPRTVDAGRIASLAALGFNRLSLRVQDFEPEVQKAVKRIQSVEATAEIVTAPANRSRCSSISFPRRVNSKPGRYRPLGIPTIGDRVCQQAMLNRLEPIFDDASFGYRRGRSARDALSKVWREIEQGNEWIVDADLEDFFGSVDHDKLLTLVNQRVADGRVLGLIERMLKAGCVANGKRFPTEEGTPQGGEFAIAE